jgi:uncharacterized RDD family membrane protein YckC
MDPTKVVGRRVAAFILDGIIAGVVDTAIFFALAKKQDEVLQAIRTGDLSLNDTLYGNLTIGDNTYSVYGSSAGLYFALVIAFGLFYWVILPGMKGWTLGKLATGTRIVKDDGSLPPGIGRQFGRQFLWIADYFPYFIPGLTAFITASTGERHQRLGDRVANTLVVRKEAVGNLAGVAQAGGAAPPPGLAPEFQSGNAPNWPQ